MLKIILSITSLYCSYTLTLYSQPLPKHDLNFAHLAATWDEGIPLGNGTIGALIWQKGEHLRFSLDRADIWDMRPMKGLHRKEFSYDWIYQQVQKKEYKIVQEYFDAPYDKEPAPSKIPAGALEFDLPNNAIKSVRLSLQKALCIVEWNNGMKLTTFVHATAPVGWFRFEHATIDILPQLIAPPYEAKIATGGEVNSLLY